MDFVERKKDALSLQIMTSDLKKESTPQIIHAFEH